MRTAALFALFAFSVMAADAPRYEVASIRPHEPSQLRSTIHFGSETLFSGMTIRNVILLAWHMPPERMTGGPKWLDSELYDIRAKVPAGKGQLSMDEHYRRVQTLLTDRLRLRVHHEAKNESVYFLRVAKSGLRMAPDSSPSGTGSILPWSMIVSELSRITGWPVIDETGLKGAWHFGIRYSEETGPSIFTAVQEQLGLRLDAGKGPVDQLVIDSVERPSGN